MLVTSIFSYPIMFSKGFFPQVHQKLSLCGKGLIIHEYIPCFMEPQEESSLKTIFCIFPRKSRLFKQFSMKHPPPPPPVIRPSKTGRIMGSPVAGGRRPVLCPEHISKTTLARVMKFHG